MMEQAATFGRSGNLSGVVTEPDAPPAAERPAVVILNSGLVHKVGTFRLSVDLSRTLAAKGFRVLRFDLSGLGDSKIRTHRVPGEDPVVTDVREAMDCLAERYRATRFVLMGLCSGAENAHKVSVVDERVVGTVQMDSFAYRTKKYFIKRYAERLLSPRFAAQKLRKKVVPSQVAQVAPPGGGPQVNTIARTFPPIENVERDFKLLLRRDVRLLFIYTSGAWAYFNYKEQLRDAFPRVDFRDRLDLEFYPFAEHTFTLVRSRDKVVRRIAEWAENAFA